MLVCLALKLNSIVILFILSSIVVVVYVYQDKYIYIYKYIYVIQCYVFLPTSLCVIYLFIYRSLCSACIYFLKDETLWEVTHLSSKYCFLATAWMTVGTKGNPTLGKREGGGVGDRERGDRERERERELGQESTGVQ